MKTVRRQQGIDKHIHRWEDKVEVYGGIPMNPQYMDGCYRRKSNNKLVDCDRYGKPMGLKERNALEWWREDKRKQWLKEKDK